MPQQRPTDSPLRLPDFVIGGAPRSGTTWLYLLLEKHPDVFLAKPLRPEPKFFLVDETYRRGIDYYSSTWFSDAPPGAVAGEKSSNYLESPVAAARLHEHMPDIRLVFILREPASRAWSNYLWSKMNGLEHEDFETALALEEQREATCPDHLRFARPHAYFSRGLYAELLEPYLAGFGPDSILVLRYEDIGTAAGPLAKQLHRFLGVPSRPQDAEDVGVANPSTGEEPPLQVMADLRQRYREPNRRLQNLLGQFQGWEDE
jgi:hypothetical protein